MRRILTLALAALASTACVEDVIFVDDAPAAPTGLWYELEPSGDPDSPRGVILRWDAVNDANLAVYNVYSRASAGAAFALRGSTTSPSFHDDGVPHLEYYVTAESYNGAESEGSFSVIVDERLRLEWPASLTSVSLDGRIHLEWSDNPYQQEPNGFLTYRVYSTAYDLDNNVCGASWSLEGTTVAPTFLVGALTNGVPRCFGVTAVSIEGFESLWSPLRYDTPRPEARNIVLMTGDVDPTRTGFRFFLDANGDGVAGPLELGLVSSASATMDFIVTKDVAGTIFLTPQRTGVTLRQYGAGPIADLTAIDIAPVGGYSRTALTAVPRNGYVFQIDEGDGFYRYGAVRVTAIGPGYVILDWAYQTDRGNPELIRVR